MQSGIVPKGLDGDWFWTMIKIAFVMSIVMLVGTCCITAVLVKKFGGPLARRFSHYVLDEEMDLMRHEYEMRLATTQMRLQDSMATLEEALKKQHGFPQRGAADKKDKVDKELTKKTRTLSCQAQTCYTWWTSNPRFTLLACRNHGFFNEGQF